MKLVFGCDPNAEEMKQHMIEYAKSLGHEVTDYGSSDIIYAHTAINVAEAVAEGKFDRGVLFCGTGLGVMLAANKVKGAYAACVNDIYSAQRAVLSNNCNIITMGSQVLGEKKAEMLLKEFLDSEYVYNERSGKKVDAYVEYDNNR